MSAGTLVWSRQWPAAPLPRDHALAWVGLTAEAPPGDADPTEADRLDAGRHAGPLRDAFLRRRLLGRRLIAVLTGEPVERVVIASAGGRPRLAPPLDDRHVSAASRDGWLAVALAPAPVGIDIECLGAAREPAWNVLAPEEQDRLRRLPAPERWRAFLGLWTAKEAYLKALGLGLSREPRSIAVRARGTKLLIADAERPVRTAAAEGVTFVAPGNAVQAACVIIATR